MKVTKETAIEILAGLGIKNVKKMSEKNLLKNLQNISDLVDDDTEIEEELLKTVLKLLDADPDDIEIGEEKKPAKSKAKAPAKTATKSKGKKKSEPEEEEEEDDEDEEEDEEEDDEEDEEEDEEEVEEEDDEEDEEEDEEEEEPAPKKRGRPKSSGTKSSKTKTVSEKKSPDYVKLGKAVDEEDDVEAEEILVAAAEEHDLDPDDYETWQQLGKELNKKNRKSTPTGKTGPRGSHEKSAKARLWKIWSKNPKIKPESLLSKANAEDEVQLKTLKRWLSRWPRDLSLPAIAKED